MLQWFIRRTFLSPELSGLLGSYDLEDSSPAGAGDTFGCWLPGGKRLFSVERSPFAKHNFFCISLFYFDDYFLHVDGHLLVDLRLDLFCIFILFLPIYFLVCLLTYYFSLLFSHLLVSQFSLFFSHLFVSNFARLIGPCTIKMKDQRPQVREP